jgi:hypothetical protein
VDREHGVSLVCRLRGHCKLSHKGDAASDNNTEIRLSGCVPPGTLGEVNACRHLRQPMSNRLSLRGRLRHLTFPSPSCSRCLVLAKAIEREKKHEPGRSDAFEKLSYVCGGEALTCEKSPKAGDRELPRPLLKYARQASLVEQPTLPGLGLQYCCSSCA